MSQKLKILLICIFLAVSTIVAFWQVYQSDFVNFDDPIYVTENRYVQHGLSVQGIRWAFTSSHADFWHPLTWLSLMLDYQLYGLKPAPYHLTNLILHILSTLLLFWILNRMTGFIWRSAFVAALFAIHPLHVESVAWVAERKDTLSTFFFILTLCTYLRFTEKRTTYRYLVSLACFFLGLMAKPMMVTLPFVLLLLDYWPLNRFKPSPGLPNPPPVNPAGANTKDRKAMAARKRLKSKLPPSNTSRLLKDIPPEVVLLRLLKEKSFFFAFAMILSVITYYTQHTVSYVTFPFSARIANAIVSYTVYLAKMMWPLNLAVFYPFPQQLPTWQVFGATLLLLIITIAVTYVSVRLPYLFVGWFWYIGTLLPVIGFIQVGKHAFADRYTYIPLIGLFIIAAWAIPDLLKKFRYRQKMLVAASTLILACCFITTYTQVGYWKNSITLFEHALKVTDHSDIAHNSLGIALRSIGQMNEAESHYREALIINPDNEQVHYNLANLLRTNGKTDEAIDHYNEALRVNPNYAKAHLNLGNSFMSLGRYQNAIDHFRKAIASGDTHAGIYCNIGSALLAMGQPEEAANQFREAIRIQPDFAEAYNELGRILAMEGKMTEATVCFKEALRLKPDLASARTNLKKVESIYNKY